MPITKEQAKEALERLSYWPNHTMKPKQTAEAIKILSSLIDQFYSREELLREMVKVMKNLLIIFPVRDGKPDADMHVETEIHLLAEAVLAKVEGRE